MFDNNLQEVAFHAFCGRGCSMKNFREFSSFAVFESLRVVLNHDCINGELE